MEKIINKTCSFFGHSELEITNKLYILVKNEIENLIQNQNYSIFLFGGFSKFDDLCYKIVTELKTKYPHIQRIFCLWNQRFEEYRKRPNWLKNKEYDEYVYFPLKFDWWYTSIYYRNLEMIDKSNYIIFFVKNTEKSGSYKALQYAQKQKKHFINIAK